MKNKKKKFSSLKSVLILLQQLQIKYYRSHVFGMFTCISGSVMLSVSAEVGAPLAINFNAWDSSDVLEASYQKLLDYLNNNKL